MNLKTKLTLIIMLFSCIVIIAQDNYTLTGTVVSATDQLGIPGANVLIQGTSKGTSTDFNGNFQLEVKRGDILQFSYLGFVTQNITITNQNNLTIALAEDANTLDEVMVVGYGTQKKSHVTGAIAKVGGDDVAAIQTTRVDEALAGKLAGVLIQNQNGSPGADPKIQIRAASSINGNSNPLIVVDGYPISGSLATVNPNDIQSVEVLKDAASAAIYGSRGANGVILITTKKGKEGKPSFSYNAYASISNKYKGDRINMTAGEWANTLETGITSGKYDVSELDPDFLNYKINAYKNSPDVQAVEDWLYVSGYTTNHDFSYSGGTENSNYFASIGYQNTDGIVRTEGYERLNARINVDAKLGDKFKTGLSFNGFAADRDIVGHDQRDLLRAYNISPIYHTEASIAFVQQLDQQAQILGLDPFDNGYRAGPDAPFNQSIYTLQPGDTAQDWHYGRSGNGIGGSGDAGPATKLDNTDRYQKTYFANVSTFLQYNLMEGLKLKAVLGADIRDTKDYFWRGLEFDSRARSNQTALDETNVKQTSTLSETTLNYAKEIGSHDISAVAGIEFQKIYFRGTSTTGSNVPFSDIVNYNLLEPEDIIVRERDETISRWSIFGRVNYAFDDRYLISASIRRDGDSRFGANERYATFPAISLGWNVHNESFYNFEFLSLLKPRFSTGSLGSTSDLGAYNSLSLLNSQPTVLGTGFLIPDDIANSNLTWQTNTETNYGIDLGFINNRLRLSADYYTSDIEDILINLSVSEVFGTPSIRVNAGDVRSSGLEIELTAGIIRKEDFNWDFGGNLSTVKTEITDLGGLEELPQSIYGQSGRGPVFRNHVGGEIGEMWGLETIGQVEDRFIEDPTRAIDVNSSAFYVVDQNGDGVIDKTKTVEEGGDLVKIGQNTPDFYYGFNSSISYKAFDMSFQIQGAQGGDVWNVDPIYYNSEFGGRVRGSFDANNDGIADHNGEYYLDSNNQLDAQIQDASYLALRNLTFGYTLKPELISKIGISSARVYVASTNLLYVWGDDYTSFNPEGVNTTQNNYLGPTTYGVQIGASPIVRSFTFGFNVNF
ncbi:SusC/RagA family TonB-linked outer membrane protein [Aquimarina intermedia]|uniref:TonB-linked SusC/RagA family outer membrane protein n=1 Tax=Aquimarina intermedia TaxID=350814 RepID=A0A5S5C4E1_9FLAO|nr:TonB-dependent receptor [Aquimarina intermedia]TYP72823.1 TonB-linked SusC/RagA family outer membrane protein [Aquimarina intermedia]